MKLTTQSLLAALLTVSLAAPGAAMADRRGHGDRDRVEHHQGHYRERGHGHGHDRYGYRGYGDRHVTRVYRDRDDGRLLLGLVVGGLLGYAINNAQHDGTAYYSSPRAYPQTYAATDSYSYSDSSCLQEREYTTTVRVGGRNVEAYGTACLQPDGSWKRGPAQTVNY